ncbi:hypothetical protein LEN26_001780 [Aphanomyces euteiches]|nr:hypothetical protein LEN26_001780 [Aphanomyces euteiches]
MVSIWSFATLTLLALGNSRSVAATGTVNHTLCPPDSAPANWTSSSLTPIHIGSTDVFFFDNPRSHDLLLVFPDVYGMDSGRSKENSAKLSAWYNVAFVDLATDYLVDFDLPRLVAWLESHPFESLLPKIQQVISHFKTKRRVDKVAAVGYCWGAWVVAKYSSTPRTELSAGISFHPSWTAEEAFHGPGSGAAIANNITVPQLILTAGNDEEWIQPRGQVDQTLRARHVPARLREFQNVTHGWMNRGNLTDPAVALAFHQALYDETLPFLHSYLH